MTTFISGAGFSATLIANKTFPTGIDLIEFAKDSDPIDMPEIDVGELGMDVNGNPYAWFSAKTMEVTINLQGGTDTDKNMTILLNNNMPGRNKILAYDNITLVISYPQGYNYQFSNGIIKGGPPGVSIGSDASFKAKPYRFVFAKFSYN